MTHINAREQFGNELDDFDLIASAVAKLPPQFDQAVEIDFSGCLIDYEPASVLMDAILGRISQNANPRELTLIYNIAFQERMFLKWFFLGSKTFNLNKGTAPDEEIRQKVVNGFKSLGIRLRIITISRDGVRKLAFEV